MNIQIVRKKAPDKSITLLFKKQTLRSQHGGKIPVVCIYDEKGEYLPVSVKLTQIQSKIPSTLLSRWVNANYSEKLLTLSSRANTVEKVKDGVNKGWYFTNKDHTIYGIHKHKVTEDGNTFRTITIEDGVGMMFVLSILKELNIGVECFYNQTTNKMEKIILTGDLF